MNGDAELDEILRRLGRLPKVAEEVAPVAAEACHGVVAENIAAQRDPDGDAWPAGEDGNPVLVNAAKNVDVKAVGSTILFRVSGPEARHHQGAVKGGKARRLIPTRSVPRTIALVIRSAIERVLGS